MTELEVVFNMCAIRSGRELGQRAERAFRSGNRGLAKQFVIGMRTQRYFLRRFLLWYGNTERSAGQSTRSLLVFAISSRQRNLRIPRAHSFRKSLSAGQGTCCATKVRFQQCGIPSSREPRDEGMHEEKTSPLLVEQRQHRPVLNFHHEAINIHRVRHIASWYPSETCREDIGWSKCRRHKSA
jgi:hypothetical protein